mgnify:CR=1 FL=1
MGFPADRPLGVGDGRQGRAGIGGDLDGVFQPLSKGLNLRPLLGKLSRSVARYLNGQIAAGAQVVQLFDSWAGCLSPADYREYVLPWSQWIISALPADVPVHHRR